MTVSAYCPPCSMFPLFAVPYSCTSSSLKRSNTPTCVECFQDYAETEQKELFLVLVSERRVMHALEKREGPFTFSDNPRPWDFSPEVETHLKCCFSLTLTPPSILSRLHILRPCLP